MDGVTAFLKVLWAAAVLTQRETYEDDEGKLTHISAQPSVEIELSHRGAAARLLSDSRGWMGSGGRGTGETDLRADAL